ncbi:MAG TPA: DMT family transporter [Gemmatimonadales bacterium]|nr:DMT family transporter [Gemmatimonadales bacterium]
MLVALLLAFGAGVLLPVQAGINADLGRVLGSSLGAALASFLIGTVGLAVGLLLHGAGASSSHAWARSEWWQWSGGLLGALYVVATIVLAPRLGAATLIATVVAGQMLASLVLDQYGLVGFPLHPATWPRLLGAALVMGGVILIRR